MPIRSTPTQCNVGDGVLVSSVLTVEVFKTRYKIVQFLPDDSIPHVREGEQPIAIAAPAQWIFTLRQYNIEGGAIVDAWLRER